MKMTKIQKEIKQTTLRKEIEKERKRIMALDEKKKTYYMDRYGKNFDKPVEEIYEEKRKIMEEDNYEKWTCYLCDETFELDDDIIMFKFYKESWEYEENSNFHAKCLQKLLKEKMK
jgi:hypothetical protein